MSCASSTRRVPCHAPVASTASIDYQQAGIRLLCTYEECSRLPHLRLRSHVQETATSPALFSGQGQHAVLMLRLPCTNILAQQGHAHHMDRDTLPKHVEKAQSHELIGYSMRQSLIDDIKSD